MTNISSNFSLYWTDVTEHNLGLDEKNNPLILDAENIIIVDLEEVETGEFKFQFGGLYCGSIKGTMAYYSRGGLRVHSVSEIE